MAAHKFLKNNAGVITEEAAVATSAGAGDEGKIPALGATGVLDSSIVNSKTTSAGAGDTGKLPALGGDGKLSSTFFPAGMGADSQDMTTSEIIASGDYINIWDSTGAKVRKADASVAGKEAHGFCLVGGTQGATVTVNFEGTNTAVTGQTPGNVFLSAASPGLGVTAAPTGSGNVVQRIGFAISATAVNFQSQPPIVLA